MWSRLLLTLSFVAFLSPPAFVQEPVFRNFGVEQGLPSSEVYHAIQDSRGFIWFGTDMGVSRYDGAEFQNFDLEDGLTDNTVFEIYEDHRGRIWFLTLTLELAYYQKGTITPYAHNDKIRQITGTTRRVYQKSSFMVDSSGSLYLAIKTTGLYRIDSAGRVKKLDNTSSKDMEVFEIEDRLLIPKTSSIHTVHDDLILHKNGIPRHYRTDSFPKKPIHRAYGLKRGRRKLIYFDRHLLEFKGTDIQSFRRHGEVVWLGSDQNDRIWVGTTKGAVVYERFTLKAKTKRYLKDYTVSSVLQDHEGGVWFTTLHNGVFYAPNFQIETYTTEEGLASGTIEELASDSGGGIWLGYSEPRVGRLKDNRFIHYSVPHRAGQPGIACMYYDHYRKRLWLGRWEQLFYLDLTKSQGRVKSSPGQRQLKSIYVEGKEYWLGATQNLLHYDGDKRVYSSVASQQFRHQIEALYHKSDTLFVGTLEGLWAYAGEQYHHLGGENDLLYHRITNIEPGGGGLLLGTRGAGLLIRKGGEIYQITQQEGLISNSIKTITTWDDFIWLATNRGISRVKLKDLEKGDYEVFNLSQYNGLPSPEINDIEVRDSFLYVASNEGLTCFNMKRVGPNSYAPRIYVKNIKVNQQDTVIKNTYHLESDQNFLTLQYKGLSYRQTGHLKYQYRMLGLDSSWQETKRRVKSFTTLPPGHYIFQVKASNEDGIWSRQPLTLEFFIAKPYWQTWWFISLMVVGVSGLVWGLVHYRIRMIKRRRQLLQDINEYKQKMLRQQMNPHFIFNTLNSIQYFLLDDDTSSSLTYLSKFAKLMRIVLDNSQQTFISIEEEIRGLRLYLELEALRFEDSFDYDIIIDEDINTFEYKIPALLLQPYVENSIRHGLLHKKGRGYLKVSMTKGADCLLCMIEDNGIGRKKANEIKMNQGAFQQSLGSKITEDRIDILNSLYNNEIDIKYVDLQDERGDPTGTRVEITLPFVF